MKHAAWLCACMIAAMACGPYAAAETLSPGSGNWIKFTARQSEVPVEGEFKAFTAAIEFDPTRPEAGKASVAIDLASVSTGSGDADDLIKGRDFLDAAHNPRATFVASRFVAEAPDHYRVLGRLIMKGQASDLPLPFTVRSAPDGHWLEGSVPISRLAYKVGQGEWSDTGSLDDAVQLAFRLHLPR
jgi:polyisoprenoid-binding protein YceI